MPKKLQLWYPTYPFYIHQGFGAANTAPSLLETYKKYGLLGHNGLDLHAPTGSPVYAAHEGIVVFAGLDGATVSSGAGKTVVIRTNEPFEYLSGEAYFKTIYGHLLEFKVKVGDKVNIGQVIALADNTGDSTGPHLHFGLKPVVPGEPDWTWENLEPNNGYRGAVDPLPYFNHYYAKDIDYVFQYLGTYAKLLAKLYELLKGR